MTAMTTILSLNVQHGGGQRVDLIGRFIGKSGADIAVLSEFRANQAGEKLRHKLHGLGFHHQAAATNSPKSNSVLIASRQSFAVRRPPRVLADFAERLLLADFEFGSVLGVYFPLNDAKVPFFQALIASSPVLVASPALLVGDFNTGLHFIDESAATFVAADLFASLEKHGWLDPWRRANPSVREFSWYSRAGNGFRIDHAFVSRGAEDRVLDVSYDHTSRESRVSDHSALVIKLASDGHDERL